MLLQAEIGASLIGEIAKVGGVPAVLCLVIWYLLRENKDLKAENKELQEDLKSELKATTIFAEKMKAFFEEFTK